MKFWKTTEKKPAKTSEGITEKPLGENSKESSLGELYEVFHVEPQREFLELLQLESLEKCKKNS